ncbi:MAG TPA: lipopolysaccharide transport periplasmic protein LptA [Nitrospirae bacterium]|nr:lipopolysaccharide transport periplasmic protein LptA [Nitrospirota bacterium]
MSMRSFISIFFCIIVILMLLPASQPFAGEADRKNAPFFSERGPIEITSERLQADSNKNIAIFEGNVVAKQGQTRLYARWMKVKYDKDGQVEEIHAKGEVRLVKLDRVVTSDEAVYFSNEGKIVFTGSPVAEDKKSTVRGSKMVYYIKDGRSIVENSTVLIKGKEEEKTR